MMNSRIKYLSPENKSPDIYTDKTQILCPRKNYIYHIKSKKLPSYQVIVTFADNLPHVAYLDVSNFRYQTQPSIRTRKFEVTSIDDSLFIYKNSLPVNILQTHMPSILYYSKKEPQHLQAICEMRVKWNVHDEKKVVLENVKLAPIEGILVYNEELQRECQMLIGGIPVASGKYPIFVEHKRPSYQFLKTLYDKFLHYNDNERLNDQFNQTLGLCTARAHFTSVLLNHYNITTIKVFKEWRAYDWLKINPNAKNYWKFHCATMIIDSENRKWVWDPWYGLNNKLLTINQWLNKKNEPMAIKLILTNSIIFSDFHEGKNPKSEFLMQDGFDAGFFKAFQLMFFSAIPNPPERPISDKKNKKRLAAIKLSEYSNALFAFSKRVDRNNEQPASIIQSIVPQ